MDYSVAVPAPRRVPGKFTSRLAQFVAARASIGAVCESSRWLGRRMAAAAAGTDLPLVELGAGFGAVTRYLPETAVSIERDAARFTHLRHVFPERTIIDTCAIAFLDE